MSLRWINGVFKAKGFQTVQYEMPTVVLPGKPVVVEVPTVAPAPEPVVEAAPEPVVEAPAPEPVVEAPAPAPEPAVVEVPVAASEVEAPLEVLEAAPESGLVPEDPPAE